MSSRFASVLRLLPLIWLPGLACQAPGPAADAAAARRACGLAEGERVSAARRLDGSLERPLSADCVAHLGEDLGLDWASFGGEPQSIEAPRTPAEGLVSGAFLLIAADHGPIAGLIDDPTLEADLVDTLLIESLRVELEPQDDAGALLYAWVSSRVDRVVLDTRMVDHAAEYDVEERTVALASQAGGFDRPPWMAAVLVHEASHLDFPGHVDCQQRPSADCDPDLVGPYGLEAWAAAAYQRGLPPDSEGRGCGDALDTLRSACVMINDSGATPLCTEQLACP